MYGARSSKFVCAHWVEPLLRKFILPISSSSVGEEEKEVQQQQRRWPRILDVGAIDHQYLQYDWIDAVPIDLNARHKSVIEADSF